jgi:hypothetical protein
LKHPGSSLEYRGGDLSMAQIAQLAGILILVLCVPATRPDIDRGSASQIFFARTEFKASFFRRYWIACRTGRRR